MTRAAEHKKPEFIEEIAAEAISRLADAEAQAAACFIRQYYEWVPPADLVVHRRDTLFGAALAHLRFGMQRQPGEAKVRAYNPDLEEHGWTSEHTVLEIVNDDMPFLVDSVSAELNRRDFAVHLIIHPVLEVRRDGGNSLVKILKPDEAAEDGLGESFMHIEISRQPDARLDEIAADVSRVLADVRAAVDDWQSMRACMLAAIEELEAAPGPLDEGDASEICAFLRWVHDHNFTLLGYRAYAFDGEAVSMAVDPDTGLGLLRDPRVSVFREFEDLASLRPEILAYLAEPRGLTVVKTDRVATVHRPVHMDAVMIQRFGPDGRVVGQHLIAGLFTASAYTMSPRQIPLLRRKIEQVYDRAGLPPISHDGKALMNILETFPRDELFQVSGDHLFHTALGILNLQERQRVALFLRRDDLDRFMSCLLFVPRDRYNTDLRHRMQAIMEAAFAGHSAEWYIQLSDAPLARVHMFIRTTPGAIPDYDADEIEARLADAARAWQDALEEALISAHGEERGVALFQRYRPAFPAGYRERFSTEAAVLDIERVEGAFSNGALGLSLRRPIEAGEHQIRLKLYHPDRPIPLSDALPMLEHMGLKVIEEVPYVITPHGTDTDQVLIHDFGLESRDGAPIPLGDIREKFKETFRRVWRGEVESDGFNGLVARAGLDWREAVVLRAYCKYLRQAGIAYSQAYMEQTMLDSPELAALIVRLFLARFDPAGAGDSEARAKEVLARISDGLNAVENADQDRILRRFVNLVESTLRTNFFQPGEDGQPKPYLSFKFDSRAVEGLPLPRPLYEIWVYSPRVEGVHLRGGKVARGGIRWSDRREDFRTEVLGLMKAQMVKNAVIVPVGSKGGFVVKRPPEGGDRDAQLAEGIECYKTLMRGMLDITDNLRAGELVPPVDVVRRDDDDPYLVVAADKGTATFSDIANGISVDRGYWLGDAFASGGSNGYDHKKMGITARGAWESVKRHFREIGVNTQAEDFTVVGVGDMSGDVFGNGMLLSEHIRLIGAFNHLHIFVDPDPDAAKSFAERKRLFELPRSSWTDYDPKKISKGGGVFERRAKTVTLTPEIRDRFGIETEEVTPDELIRALLKAEVELLWFGGIGTYVKATAESQAEAGDRMNDSVRVDTSDLRCKVVGEGANLGLTQRARIEFALAGGRLNTDAIDNSAGVDTSDHEVNIKVLLNALVAEGDMTEKQRNKLLADMTDEVAGLVLRHNYLQTLAISRAKDQGVEVLGHQARLMRFLEAQGRLDRDVEFLPDDEELEEREAAGAGLTRPEVSVLMSYAKMWLYDEILESDLPDDRRMLNDLVRYFPKPLHKRYRKAIESHRLRREIIATGVTNSMINRVGGTFVARLIEETGLGPTDIARAFTVARKVFGLRALWESIEALDNQVDASVQMAMMQDINRLVDRATRWFLCNVPAPFDVNHQVVGFREGIATLADRLDEVLPQAALAALRDRACGYAARGVPEDLAFRVVTQVGLVSGLDIIRLAEARKMDVVEVGRLYHAVGDHFRLGDLRRAGEGLETQSHWQRLAVEALIEEIYGHQVALTDRVLNGADQTSGEAIKAWVSAHRDAVGRAERMLGELWASEIRDVSMIAVASRQLRGLLAAIES